ncbi:hypothetical protein ACFOEP_13150 [Microbacterium amylolyticum]|uniref:hypothetical protein n=1 Tax=Microbacterium amylolyticum TaxID=936337 RepID=UPI0036133E9C
MRASAAPASARLSYRPSVDLDAELLAGGIDDMVTCVFQVEDARAEYFRPALFDLVRLDEVGLRSGMGTGEPFELAEFVVCLSLLEQERVAGGDRLRFCRADRR